MLALQAASPLLALSPSLADQYRGVLAACITAPLHAGDLQGLRGTGIHPEAAAVAAVAAAKSLPLLSSPDAPLGHPCLLQPAGGQASAIASAASAEPPAHMHLPPKACVASAACQLCAASLPIAADLLSRNPNANCGLLGMLQDLLAGLLLHTAGAEVEGARVEAAGEDLGAWAAEVQAGAGAEGGGDKGEHSKVSVFLCCVPPSGVRGVHAG